MRVEGFTTSGNSAIRHALYPLLLTKQTFIYATACLPWAQEETSGALLIERAPDPETDDAVPIAGCSTAMTSRAHLVRNAGPGTAAEAMAAAIAGHPRRSVGRCAPVILV
jgi:hypothetical protein